MIREPQPEATDGSFEVFLMACFGINKLHSFQQKKVTTFYFALQLKCVALVYELLHLDMLDVTQKPRGGEDPYQLLLKMKSAFVNFSAGYGEAAWEEAVKLFKARKDGKLLEEFQKKYGCNGGRNYYSPAIGKRLKELVLKKQDFTGGATHSERKEEENPFEEELLKEAQKNRNLKRKLTQTQEELGKVTQQLQNTSSNTTIKNLQEQIKTLEQGGAKKEKQIQALQKEIAEQKENQTKLQQRNVALTEQLAEKKGKIKAETLKKVIIVLSACTVCLAIYCVVLYKKAPEVDSTHPQVFPEEERNDSEQEPSLDKATSPGTSEISSPPQLTEKKEVPNKTKATIDKPKPSPQRVPNHVFIFLFIALLLLAYVIFNLLLKEKR